MSPYTTLTLSRSDAIYKIEARLALAPNTKLRECLGVFQEFIDGDPEDRTRAETIEEIRDLMHHRSLDLAPPLEPHSSCSFLHYALGEMLDIMFSEETLNNFIVVEKVDESDQF